MQYIGFKSLRSVLSCCAVVRGSTIPGTVVLPIATPTIRTSASTLSVFVLSVRLRVLFCTRTGRWESVGRVREESRPAPVILVTGSENKTELSSLVSCKAERLLNSCSFLIAIRLERETKAELVRWAIERLLGRQE